VNYVWIESEVMIGGIVLSDTPLTSSANKRRRRSQTNSVRKIDLTRAIDRMLSVHRQAQEQLDAYQQEMRHAYEQSPDFKKEILAEIKGDLDRSLSQAHDYVSLLRQIRQHILAILERQFPGVPPQEAAERLPNEGAIYFASELMYEKLDATKFLRNPAMLYGPATTFVLHQFLSKYVKIFRGIASQRNIDLGVGGESRKAVRYFGEPIGAAFQALLDNALKYSPTSSKVDIVFLEGSDTVKVTLSSFGPRILPSESDSIFREGFRAKGAEEIEDTGMGLGLAIAKLVSDELQLQLRVEQESEPSPRHPRYYATTFSMVFRAS
jgi:signal transduction histidine kinase